MTVVAPVVPKDDLALRSVVFEVLRAQWDWRPIANCPGRYSLPANALPPGQLVAHSAIVTVHHPAGTRDPVHVVCFPDGGGLISYQRSNGQFVHTLNTREGFWRKLSQLKIDF